MATNTPNLNLVKPEMSDYADIRVLNGNMDILDNAIPLNYVKTVTKSDDGLTFTKKDDTQVEWKHPYIVEQGINYIKYSDGTAFIFDRTGVAQYNGTYTYPIPLISVQTAVATYTNFSDSWVANIDHVVHEIGTTSLNIQVKVVTGVLDGNIITSGYIHIMGKWK